MWMKSLNLTTNPWSDNEPVQHTLRNYIYPVTMTENMSKTSMIECVKTFKTKNVVFVLSGHGSSTPHISRLRINTRETISLIELYEACRKNTLHVIFLVDTCRRTFSEEITPAVTGTWNTELPDVIILEVTKRNRLASQYDFGGLLPSVLFSSYMSRLNQKLDTQACIDIVCEILIDATEKVIPKIIDSQKSQWARLISLASKLVSEGTPFRQLQARTHFIAHFTPQVYMNSRMLQQLQADDTAIIRSTTGVPVGSVHDFRIAPDVSTVTRT